MPAKNKKTEPQPVQLNSEDAQNVMKLLQRVQIQGAEAPAYMNIMAKLNSIAFPPQEKEEE